MAKKTVQKATVKKSTKTAAKKSASGSKKTTKASGAGVKTKKAPLSEKEKAFRMANVIENSERKETGR